MLALVHHSNRRRSRPAPAFSLAEMMIALVILGFGLIVVGAALPVGLTYTRETIDRATGAAAAEYALDVIKQNIRLCRDPWDEAAAQPLRYRTDIFRPRWPALPPPPAPYGPGELLADPIDATRSWEPLVKVRPLLAVSINPADLSEPFDPGALGTPHRDLERRLMAWVLGAEYGPQDYKEYDQAFTDDLNWLAPALPSVSVVYPPVTHDMPFTVGDFLPTPGNPQYWISPVTIEASRKALERQITWVAFYRRVSYAPGSDPNLYEVVAVATRRPSAGHRFPRFDPSGQVQPTHGSGAGRAPYDGGDTLAPVPWLIVFAQLPAPPPANLNLGPYDSAANRNRLPDPSVPAPPTLRFVCGATDGQLLPPGSIFIPAVNCDRPSLLNPGPALLDPPDRLGGFVPHAPDTLPIYEVLDRILDDNGTPSNPLDDTYDIIVKNNGFYPWARNDYKPFWPVWVIPPAFKELDTSVTPARPIYDDRSPILAVARRVIRFAEVP